MTGGHASLGNVIQVQPCCGGGAVWPTAALTPQLHVDRRPTRQQHRCGGGGDASGDMSGGGGDDRRWQEDGASPAKRAKQDAGQCVLGTVQDNSDRGRGIERDCSDVGSAFIRGGEETERKTELDRKRDSRGVHEQDLFVPSCACATGRGKNAPPVVAQCSRLQSNFVLDPNLQKLSASVGDVRQCFQEHLSGRQGGGEEAKREACRQDCEPPLPTWRSPDVATAAAMECDVDGRRDASETAKATEAEREDLESYARAVLRNGLASYARMAGKEAAVATGEEVEDVESYARAVLHEGLGEWTRFLYYVGPSKTKNSPVKYRVCRTLLLDEVLCSDRVSQMTKTYNDIEAVTRLLAEKEKDLELTARIGKQLLDQNNKYELSIASLEAELKLANDKLTQLSHELIKKTELIQILTNDVDDSSSESGTPNGLRCINLDLMQRRIGSLEDENRLLRNEASQLFSDTAECEAAEQRLVQDIASQLANANMEVDSIADELSRYKEESRVYHEESVLLATKLYEADNKIDKLSMDNDDLSSVLGITRENQALLATELADLKDRYAEVLSLLEETQEQLRRQRKKGMPTARGGLFPSLGSSALFNPDSLASELECSLYSELSADSGISTDRLPNYKKVFETVRSASRNSASSGLSAAASPAHQLYPRVNPLQPFGGPGNPTLLSSTGSGSGPRMSCVVSAVQGNTGRPPLEPQRHIGSAYGYGSSLSFPSMDSMGHSDSEYSTTSEDCSYPGAPPRGVPGVPGAADLEAALRRLTPAQVISRRSALSSGSYEYSDGIHTPPMFLPFGCRTPDSIMSTGSSGFSNNSNGWKLPEKLQIVKPLEGSLTLATWSQLATPTLGGLLDERPGVQTRGGRPLEDLGLKTYALCDLEEDDEYGNPGKSFQGTGSVYTFTNSTVMHPDDMTSVTHSLRGSQMTTASSSRQPTAPPTPAGRSRRNSTSTFSTALGLAKMLNERGIKAVTPSCVTTPSFTPTATPCNSPDGSPPPSRSGSPPRYSPINFPGFLSSGADLLRRTFSSEMVDRGRAGKRGTVSLSRADRKVLSGIRIVEQLERIGLETIMATSASAVIPTLNLGGAMYTCRTLKSPMAQLALKTAPAATSPAVTAPGAVPPSSRHAPGARPGGRSPPRKGKVRQDLGTVLGMVPSRSEPASALGTIGTMLFGRKGGLL